MNNGVHGPGNELAGCWEARRGLLADLACAAGRCAGAGWCAVTLSAAGRLGLSCSLRSTSMLRKGWVRVRVHDGGQDLPARPVYI